MLFVVVMLRTFTCDIFRDSDIGGNTIIVSTPSDDGRFQKDAQRWMVVLKKLREIGTPIVDEPSKSHNIHPPVGL